MQHRLPWLPPALLVVSAFAAPSGAQQVRTIDTLVDVGAYQLSMRIIAGGSTTIVLESGGGLDRTQWDSLAPRLARVTGATVVAYDRPGFGATRASDASVLDRELRALWDALEQLSLSQKVILVGHSYGGLLIQAQAAAHPTEVQGLVFVDPNTATFVDATGGPGYPTMRGEIDRLDFDTTDLSRLTPYQRGIVRQERAFPAMIAEMRHTRIPTGIPIRVITAGKPWWPTAELNRAWRDAHEELVRSVHDGRLLVADRSDHMIPAQQPELIVAAVKELLTKRD